MRHLTVALLAVFVSAPAQAQQRGIEVEPWVGALVTGLALAGTLALSQIPVDEDRSVDASMPEWVGLDAVFRGTSSLHADAISNATLVGAMALPLVAHFSLGVEDAGDSVFAYAEVLGTTILLNTAAKRLAQRARPYTYDERAFAELRSSDSFLSFYSGHSAVTFAAATTAGATFAMRSDHEASRAGVWALGLSLASATAVLRIRAGRHFPSDVVVGAVAGAGVGLLIPYLHHTGEGDPAPSTSEALAIAGGVLGGALLAWFWPLDEPPPLKVIPLADGGAAAVLDVVLP